MVSHFGRQFEAFFKKKKKKRRTWYLRKVTGHLRRMLANHYSENKEKESNIFLPAYPLRNCQTADEGTLAYVCFINKEMIELEYHGFANS